MSLLSSSPNLDTLSFTLLLVFGDYLKEIVVELELSLNVLKRFPGLHFGFRFTRDYIGKDQMDVA